MKFGKQKKSFLGRTKPQSGEMELQITSMADIFTILLVFLLKGYSTDATGFVPAAGLKLPTAHAAEAPVEALKVEITETAVLVAGQPIAVLKNYIVDSNEVAKDGSAKSLTTAFEGHRKRQVQIASANSDVKVDAKVLVAADQKVPYQTLKTVLASAAVHGFTDFKLAVVKGE